MYPSGGLVERPITNIRMPEQLITTGNIACLTFNVKAEPTLTTTPRAKNNVCDSVYP